MDCGETIGLKALLAEVAGELTPLAAEKQVAISVAGQETEIAGNKSLLRRAFYNLVENAIKYNVDGGAVNVTVSGGRDHGCVIVEDTGIGIPQEAQALIFEPFYRVDRSRSRLMGGAGLGLATAKAIIEKHGGRIQVSSGPRGGTQFQIRLSQKWHCV